MKNRQTLFISDLHLDSREPDAINHFFYFLDHIAPTAEALYILGDFFESYIGDDNNDPLIPTLSHALYQLTQSGVPVFFMRGNRDFLVGNTFIKKSGVTLLTDPTVISLNNQKILLMHGDSLCTDDKSHQRFRRITQYSITKRLFLLLSLSLRQKIAKKLRDDSQAYHHIKPSNIMDVNENAVKQALKTHDANLLIHGHTHRPMISEKRIVLGAWHAQGNYLQIDQNDKKELIEF